MKLNIEEFINKVEELRTNQKSFFKAQSGTREKIEFLHESKRLEKEVDKMISDYRNPQSSMF